MKQCPQRATCHGTTTGLQSFGQYALGALPTVVNRPLLADERPSNLLPKAKPAACARA